MASRREIQNIERLYNRCGRISIQLSNALEELSREISQLTNRNIRADLCCNGEIEFRDALGESGYTTYDEFSMVTFKDIIEELQNNN